MRLELLRKLMLPLLADSKLQGRGRAVHLCVHAFGCQCDSLPLYMILPCSWQCLGRVEGTGVKVSKGAKPKL